MQRLALAQLLQMDEMRLADLGLSRTAILEALRSGSTHTLNAHRSRAASDALHQTGTSHAPF